MSNGSSISILSSPFMHPIKILSFEGREKDKKKEKRNKEKKKEKKRTNTLENLLHGPRNDG